MEKLRTNYINGERYYAADLNNANSIINELEDVVVGKQDILTPGNGIEIENNTIKTNVINDRIIESGKTFSSVKIMELINGTSFSVKVVDELPVSGDVRTIYFVPNEKSGETNVYVEYLYIDGEWEQIGDTKIDLSVYYTKDETDEMLSVIESSITNEIEDRINADSAITANLDAEATARVAADSALTVALETETAARVAADSAITVDLETETAARVAADSALTVEINNKQDIISDLDEIRSGATLGMTALQSFTETDPTVPAWAKEVIKPSYTAEEVGALSSATTIPSKTSDLTNDSGFITGYTEGENIIISGDTISADLSDYYNKTEVDEFLDDIESGLTLIEEVIEDIEFDISGLTIELAGKSDTGHTHVAADVTDLQGLLDDKSNTGHTHNTSELNNDFGFITGYTVSVPETINELNNCTPSQYAVQFDTPEDGDGYEINDIPFVAVVISTGQNIYCNEMDKILVNVNGVLIPKKLSIFYLNNGEVLNITSDTITQDDTAWYQNTLVEAKIGKGVSLGFAAFADCTELQTVILPNGLNEISDTAFLNCVKLKTATIPNTVTRICRQAFCECLYLEEITIPSGVTSIGEAAFQDCSEGVESINIPDGVVSIGLNAFNYVRHIEYHGTATWEAGNDYWGALSYN